MNIYLDEPLNTSTQNIVLPYGMFSYEQRKEEIEDLHKELGYKILGFIGVWRGNDTRIIVDCPIHNEWNTSIVSMLPGKNRTGRTCRKCFSEEMGNRYRCTKEEFVIKANKVHNNKYTYEKFEYVGSFVNVIITCHIHGDFPQMPTSHLSKSGCFGCGLESRRIKRRSNTEEFITKAKAKHGDNYSYDKFVYVKSNQKSIITCKLHGDYPLTPNTHLTKK